VAYLIRSHLSQPLRDGDVVVVASKVVSKALGLNHQVDREGILLEQIDRVVAVVDRLRSFADAAGLRWPPRASMPATPP
jgi:coenzyme F420-0:L-glutamate ligase / coenzyme F420-1:gamma-L-glutamate ligase